MVMTLELERNPNYVYEDAWSYQGHLFACEEIFDTLFPQVQHRTHCLLNVSTVEQEGWRKFTLITTEDEEGSYYGIEDVTDDRGTYAKLQQELASLYGIGIREIWVEVV